MMVSSMAKKRPNTHTQQVYDREHKAKMQKNDIQQQPVSVQSYHRTIRQNWLPNVMPNPLRTPPSKLQQYGSNTSLPNVFLPSNFPSSRIPSSRPLSGGTDVPEPPEARGAGLLPMRSTPNTPVGRGGMADLMPMGFVPNTPMGLMTMASRPNTPLGVHSPGAIGMSVALSQSSEQTELDTSYVALIRSNGRNAKLNITLCCVSTQTADHLRHVLKFGAPVQQGSATLTLTLRYQNKQESIEMKLRGMTP